jgi:hypothetical protein
LREWYSGLEAVRSGSVVWTFDARALEGALEVRDRYSVDDFDALLDRLPSEQG